jgi:hypothetical protein
MIAPFSDILYEEYYNFQEYAVLYEVILYENGK